MSATTVPPTTPDAGAGRGLEPRGGGWFVRITVIVIVILWLIPTLGVLITSFRPEALVDSTGWWTALAHPFRTTGWTLENYRLALDAGGLGNAFLNSLAVAIPATVIPITIAAFAAYAFSWMEFRGRYVLFVGVVALLVVPLQMALIPILKLYNNGAVDREPPDLPRPRPRAVRSSASGSRTPASAFRSAIYLLRNYIGPSRPRSSSRRRSTAPTTSRSSGG